MPSRRGQVSSFQRTRIAFGGAAALSAILLHAPSASAQTPPPPPPPAAQPVPYAAPPPYGAPVPYGQQPVLYYQQPSSYAAGPRIMDYEEGDPIPEGYHVQTRARRGLIVGGAVTFGVTYLLSTVFGATLEAADKATGGTGGAYTPLYIPVAGPFITIGSAGAEGGGIFMLMLDGLAQAGGVAMLIGGIAAPSTKLVRNDLALSLRPMVTENTVGFGLSGSL